MTFKLNRPSKCDVVIFDSFAIQGITPLLANHSYSIFENRRSIIHVWALAHMLLRLRFSWLAYCVSYLRLCNPRVVITGIDSNPLFYKLKHELPDTRFIAVQNGLRGTGSPRKGGDFWSALSAFGTQKPFVDVVATFGAEHSRQYSRHITCEAVAIGSSRSNSILVRRASTANQILQIAFISNFSGVPYEDVFPDGTAPATSMYLGEEPIPASRYFAIDARIAASVSRVCQQNNWDFNIVGRRDRSFPHERIFFADACAGSKFNFLEKQSETWSYEYLDGVDLIVTIDSTLGYEMVARGAKVLFVSARASQFESEHGAQFSFGFPGQYSDNGAFWTTSLEQADIEQLMHSILALDDDVWKVRSGFVTRELMCHDPNNERLRSLLCLPTVRPPAESK